MSEHELSAVPREARAFQGQTAGVVTRFVAAVVDVPLVALALLSAYIGLVGLKFLVDPRGFDWPDPSIVPFLAIMAGLMVIYLTIAWALGGRTFGNMLMGIRVVTVRGHPLGWIRSFLRAVAYIALPIGLFWSAVDRRGRSVQDLVVRSTAVYDWRPRSARLDHPVPGHSPRAVPREGSDV